MAQALARVADNHCILGNTFLKVLFTHTQKKYRSKSQFDQIIVHMLDKCHYAFSHNNRNDKMSREILLVNQLKCN